MKLTSSSKLFKAKLAGRNTEGELEIFGRILILSQQGYTNLGKHDMNVRTNRKILAHIGVCVFQISCCVGAGSQYNLNMHSKRKSSRTL